MSYDHHLLTKIECFLINNYEKKLSFSEIQDISIQIGNIIHFNNFDHLQEFWNTYNSHVPMSQEQLKDLYSDQNINSALQFYIHTGDRNYLNQLIWKKLINLNYPMNLASKNDKELFWQKHKAFQEKQILLLSGTSLTPK